MSSGQLRLQGNASQLFRFWPSERTIFQGCRERLKERITVAQEGSFPLLIVVNPEAIISSDTTTVSALFVLGELVPFQTLRNLVLSRRLNFVLCALACHHCLMPVIMCILQSRGHAGPSLMTIADSSNLFLDESTDDLLYPHQGRRKSC